jgi:hypothetical protein
LPAAQLVQAAELVCAVNPENLPAPQLVQAAELVCAVKPENLPAAQSVHTEAPTACESWNSIKAEYLPAGQSVQMVEAAASAYLPAAQEMQPIITNTSISAKFRHVLERGWTTNTYLPVAPHVTVMTASPGRFDAHAGLPSNELTFPTLISAP